MKKIVFIILILASCSYDLKQKERIYEEAKCKADLMIEISKDDNVLILSRSKGMTKEYDEVFSKIKDSSTTCSKSRQLWNTFTTKLVTK